MSFGFPLGFPGSGSGSDARNLKQISDALGISTSLVLCLDAGAITSAPAGTQTWSDLSGQNNNFFRGTTSGAEGTDPTFNGTAGGLTAGEYFSNDGGDVFVQTAAQTFSNSWHKAAAKFSIIAIAYPVAGTVRLFENLGASGPGTDFYLASGKIGLEINDGTGTVFQPIPTATFTASAWNFVAITEDEPNTCFIRTNTATQTFAGNYTNTVPTNPGGSNRLFLNAANGARLGGLMAWNRVLSSTEIANLYTECKKRWTTLP